MRRVVITGLGVVSPVGIGKEQFWQNLSQGVSGGISLEQITSSPLFGHHTFGAQVVCAVEPFIPEEQHIAPEHQTKDRFIQFALAATQQAWQDAQIDRETIDPERVGVTFATAICGTKTLDEEFVKVTAMGQQPIRSAGVSPHLYAAAMGNSAALIIAAQYGLQGECVTLSTGCIGGVDAISYAYEQIVDGDYDMMVAGASEAPITPITLASFDIIHCLSHYTDPTTASRPFDQSRSGFVLSEGSGIVILEELEHALARQAPIYAEIKGYDVTQHATHMTDMSPEGRDLARAVQGALQQAHLTPAEIDMVNAHGTSTPQNDIFETQALKSALGEHAYTIPVNSTKSMLGHALAAASAEEIVACALSIQNQAIHPTINLENPEPGCDLDYVPHQGREHAITWLLTTASGFSGLHAALIMGTYSA
ncbi:MAG TPA: beta-ketoacyl-[acyl-carrier-protein] synthase family protein [Ktedonobacteraceae bacterium]|jgi:3-oxoacyl-(acyl-carrier-protein) synthase|nr:beta-ketoacyl-[acyl-carrier-protein] synthase family protein [Ktedonobacteraceae bacterium]